jgi:hypothetical protein
MIDWVCALKDMKSSYKEGTYSENPKASVSPMMDQQKSGPLELYLNGKWKKRWYTLKDGVLAEYKSKASFYSTIPYFLQTSTEAIAKTPLFGTTFEEYKKFKNGFAVYTNSGTNALILKADSEEEVSSWLSLLKVQKASLQRTLDSIQ